MTALEGPLALGDVAPEVADVDDPAYVAHCAAHPYRDTGVPGSRYAHWMQWASVHVLETLRARHATDAAPADSEASGAAPPATVTPTERDR